MMEKQKCQPNTHRFWTLKTLLVLAVALGARWLWVYYVSSPSIRGDFWIFLFPIFFCPFALLVLCFIGLLHYFFLKPALETRNVIPLILLILGVFLIFQIPMYDGPSAAKWHFLAHRTEYETVAELARQHQLDHADCGFRYRLPSELAHIFPDNCVSVIEDLSNQVAVVEFDGLENSYYYFVAYGGCPDDADLNEEIDDGWYICEWTWD